MFHRLTRFARTALLACSTALAVSAMDNTDVIKMVDAGLGDDVILTAVRTAAPADFDTSTDGLIELKRRSISDPIIQAMIVRQQGGSGGDNDREGQIQFTHVPDADVVPPEIDPAAGNDYFLRYSFKYEKGVHVTTNYWRGDFLPINTPVQLFGINGDKITLRLIADGTTVTVKNVESFSKRSTEQVARGLLSDTPTAIEKYGADMEHAIEAGTLRLGMTKTQVIMTRGYPPAHQTPSLDGDLWKYWSSRFVIQSLAFDKDVLIEARGVH